jgi:hypothetical protein
MRPQGELLPASIKEQVRRRDKWNAMVGRIRPRFEAGGTAEQAFHLSSLMLLCRQFVKSGLLFGTVRELA